MIKITLDSYDSKTSDCNFDTDIVKINEIEFSYDGGRLYVYCNGKEIVSTHLAGIDFNLKLELK